MVREYRVVKCREKEAVQFMIQIKARVIKGQVKVDALLVITHCHGDVWVWVPAKGLDLVHVPDAVVEVCVDVNGSCYHQGPYECIESRTLPVTKLMSKKCVPTPPKGPC